MNNKQFAPKVRAWLKSTEVGPEDLPRSVGIVSGKAERTGQRGRWWPLPSLRRRKASEATQVETQSSPIPAANGHTPTVIGRTQTMFSPAKAIAAGAILFAIGGAFLIAQPFQQQRNVPGAATDPSVSVVRGQYILFGEDFPPEDLALDGMLERSRGAEQSGRLLMSDDRLSGDVTFVYNIDRWETDEVDEGDVALFWGTVLIENEGGRWEGTHLTADGQARDRPFVSPVVQLSGSGDYDGMSAVVYFTSDPLNTGLSDSVDGIIFDGELPPDR